MACRILLPLPLLRNLLPATRCRRRCRRILLLHHVRRAWGRRTSLLLLISVAAGTDGNPGCGHKKFKRPPETSAGTAGDYSTTFGAGCKDCRHRLLSQGARKGKKNTKA